MLRTLYTAVAVLVSIPLVVLNLRLYHGPASAYAYPAVGADVGPHLRAISARLKDGQGAEMQGLFPEGYFFSHVLYGLSWVEAARREQARSTLYDEALNVDTVVTDPHGPRPVRICYHRVTLHPVCTDYNGRHDAHRSSPRPGRHQLHQPRARARCARGG